MSENKTFHSKEGGFAEGDVITPGFFSTVRTLTVMQLKEKMNMEYLRSFRKTLFKTLWLLIEFAAITAICYLAMYFIRLMGLFSLVGDIPDTVMNIIFTFMMALSLLFGTAGLVKSLYFSRDNMVLLTFPATSSTVFLSKLAVYYVYEFRKNFMFMIPLFVSYGMIKGYPWYFYPWLLLMFLFISALPVILSALLSIPSMFVYQWVRKVKGLQYAIYTLLAAVGVAALYLLIGLIPENINLARDWGTIYWQIQQFLDDFRRATPIMYAFLQLTVGRSSGRAVSLFTANTALHFAILLGVTAAALGLCLLIARPLFYKMASKPFEYTKKVNPRAARNTVRSGFGSALKKETVSGLRSNALITDAMIAVVAMPLAIRLLNKIYSAMNTRLLGSQMTVSFTVLIILLILLSTNINLASCYSRDGAASYLNKIQPKRYESLLFAKLVPNLAIGFVGTAATVAIYTVGNLLDRGSAIPVKDTVLLGLSVFFFFAAHLFWSAEMDIMNPQSAQYATFDSQGNNPNENKSALLVFVISFLGFALSLLLSMGNASNAWIKIALISFVLMAAKIVTFTMKIKVFYHEKT